MTTIPQRSRIPVTPGLSRLAGPCLIVGGVAFFVGGVTHPSDSGQGNKVQQLYEAMVSPGWYPSHAALVLAMALFAVTFYAMRQRQDLTPGVARVLQLVFVIACLSTVAMLIHLVAAIDAASLADGEPSLISRIQTVNEMVFNSSWGLAIAAVALVGGWGRQLGNRVTIVFGVAGGLAFALASATIPYTDTFDPLFKVGSLVAIWAILVGITLVRRPS